MADRKLDRRECGALAELLEQHGLVESTFFLIVKSLNVVLPTVVPRRPIAEVLSAPHENSLTWMASLARPATLSPATPSIFRKYSSAACAPGATANAAATEARMPSEMRRDVRIDRSLSVTCCRCAPYRTR